ncbi:helix-turn-helix domain-containing protein [Salinarimonas soli]|uniref:Helix-turn-helix transcriptional regulator n=1 Tax=Salinarimonas soli TaxID=1638099 RepID=A0A5B2VBU3_9HYPH|nr:helix-turn-helix transcriptional regulator [Salinarimonas soli]KAA2236434.1 helix-turn-helix transcriptional regulator [Salinarimonas soli]
MSEAPFTDVGRRLRLMRDIMGWSQMDLCRMLDIGQSRWSAYETGRVGMPIYEARRLKRLVPGLTLDYLYEGDTRHLTLELAMRLGLLEGQPGRE